jgi:hypothetical protein
MAPPIVALTRDWGTQRAVSLYLDRCQVDTPSPLVQRVWALIRQRRRRPGLVLDLGAGDARFARHGVYAQYLGIEIDPSRAPAEPLPPNAVLTHRCAFSHPVVNADICLGNPPYVRNQDLPSGWRELAATVILQRIGVRVSGLANAWQYFMFLALANTKADGLVALVVPYEWVSRPSARSLRDYVRQNGWDVDCYRLRDGTFDHVLTTCSIAIIDKRRTTSKWSYFEENEEGDFTKLRSLSGARRALDYRPNYGAEITSPRVKRGLSPGTQRWLVLTEAARARHGLRVGRDVVACVTSLRVLKVKATTLTESLFRTEYRDAGVRCWLVRTDREPSRELRDYLDTVPPGEYDNWTCNGRDEWWRFGMPGVPAALIASGFRGKTPKMVCNGVGAIAVGGVTGLHGVSGADARRLVARLRRVDLGSKVVAHSNGLRKVEIGQLQALIDTL